VRVLVLVTLKFVVSNFGKGLRETGEYTVNHCRGGGGGGGEGRVSRPKPFPWEYVC